MEFMSEYISDRVTLHFLRKSGLHIRPWVLLLSTFDFTLSILSFDFCTPSSVMSSTVSIPSNSSAIVSATASCINLNLDKSSYVPEWACSGWSLFFRVESKVIVKICQLWLQSIICHRSCIYASLFFFLVVVVVVVIIIVVTTTISSKHFMIGCKDYAGRWPWAIHGNMQVFARDQYQSALECNKMLLWLSFLSFGHFSSHLGQCPLYVWLLVEWFLRS